MNTLHLRSNPFFRKGAATWTLLLSLTIAALRLSLSAFASSPESAPAITTKLISSLKNVLVLFSYHRAEWSYNVQKGIESVFTPYKNVNFFYEYMDTKRLKTKEYLDTLRKIYTEQYAKAHIDLIFCVDNNALELLVENAQTLLPDILVISLSQPQTPVYVRLYSQCHRPSRGARRGHPFHPETVFDDRSCRQSQRST